MNPKALAAALLGLTLAVVLPPSGKQEPTGGDTPVSEKSSLHDITGIEPVAPAPPLPRGLIVLISAGALLAITVVATGWVIRRKGGRKFRPPPDQWALAELDRIEAMKLPEAGEVQRFHTVLSDLARQYLELRFQLPASRQTTAEFLEAILAAPHLSSPQQELLRQFLRRCDLAKFARAEFSVQECQSAAQMARDLVGQTAGHLASLKLKRREPR